MPPHDIGGLINPPQESSVCAEMIVSIQRLQLPIVEAITHRAVDHDTYLQRVGELAGLRAAETALTAIYQRTFKR